MRFQVQNVICSDYQSMHVLKFSTKSYVSFNFSASYVDCLPFLDSKTSYCYLLSRILLNSIIRSHFMLIWCFVDLE